ncbi:LysE family translocator [Rhodobium gokarnense]|uniref:Threonine/homoserine/homoserine lactone efflux protein n=1 Tax=Rhodobium gokarnense TaxID=364296 RepID=A0ABT3HGW6_9HYPH|nr:LysE family translocator [Rhodobium gokarnense]MCW2309511.1 threonine/homoserine/homoserine lactone efflux protein [Rhodobium gokarnense]
MLDPVTLTLFIATVAVFVFTPGPNMIFCVSKAIIGGPSAGVMSAVGVCIGLVVHAGAAGLGLSKLFQYFPIAYDVLRVVGAGYLLWLAWKSLHETGGLPAECPGTIARPGKSGLRFIVEGALNALLSPKAVFFYIVLFPQFLDPARGSVFVQSLLLIAIINAMNFTVISTLCLFAGKTSAWLAHNPSVLRWQRRIVAGVFAGLAMRVLFSRQTASTV